MKITIIGNGVWGNALLHVIENNYKNVIVVKRGETIAEADVFVLSVPTQSIRDILQSIPKSKKHTVIVNTAKGIEKTSHKLPHEIVSELLGNTVSYYSLIGPSFAEEVSSDMPTLVNLGYIKKSSENKTIQKIFQTKYFRVKLTENVNTLELSAALKNIYAISCGLVDGLGHKTNTRTEFIILALQEMNALFRHLNLKQDENSVIGTVGDLILTCNSEESRNFRFGRELTNFSAKIALENVKGTVEGYHTLASIPYFEKKAKIKLKLASFIKDIVYKESNKSIKDRFGEFIKSL